MIPELGVFCLILAFCLACIPAALLAAGEQHRTQAATLIRRCVWLNTALIIAALGALMYARVVSDFSVILVTEHSNRSLPLLYKIVGTWGNHEGSMLLWAGVMAVFSTILSLQKREEPTMRVALCVQSALLAGVLAFILFTSNPFLRIFPPPYDGRAFNPLLQDIALAMHPPILYIGYVGFSVVFSWSVAGLMQGKINASWASAAKPWILIPWAALTIGIALGSWWAYRVLGWGGFWFWDPVENASLLPWLTGTALLHSNLVLERRGGLAAWVPLLAILTFAMSLIGTFLVRSGLLTSVHSFASDPTRGGYILVYFVIVIGGALMLYAIKPMQPSQRLPFFSREGTIVLNNGFFLTACFTLLIGTLYPLLAQAFGQEISVGAPYFQRTVLPILAGALVIGGIAPRIAWGRDTFSRLSRYSVAPFFAAIMLAVVVITFAHREVALAAIGLGLAAWMAVGAYTSSTGRRLPVMLAHGGAALVIVGIVGTGLWSVSDQAALRVGEKLQVGPYIMQYKHVLTQRRSNHLADIAQLHVTDMQGKPLAQLAPEYRLYDIRNQTISTPSISSRMWGDMYAVSGGLDEEGKTMLTLRLEPLIHALWLGALSIAVGGMWAAARRRK